MSPQAARPAGFFSFSGPGGRRITYTYMSKPNLVIELYINHDLPQWHYAWRGEAEPVMLIGPDLLSILKILARKQEILSAEMSTWFAAGKN